MTNQAIIDYNATLIKIDSKCDIIDYIKHINSMYENPIELSFMEELLGYVELDTCCIPHILLVKYGILSDKYTSSHVKRLLSDYNFIENKDYSLISNVGYQSDTSRGIKYIKNYLLHPNTFKFCIMRSKNTKIYAKYYILLERSIKYYHDYQIMCRDTKIFSLEDTLAGIRADHIENKQLHAETRSELKQIHYKFDNLSEVLLERTEEAEISKSETKLASDDRINIPTKVCNIEHMVVLKSNIDSIYKYRMIRGTYSYIKAQIGSLAGIYFKRLSKNNTNPWLIDESIKAKREYELAKIYTDIPNARHLFRAVKDKDIITFNGVNFNILISEEEVFIKFQEAFDSRLTIEIEEKEILIAKNKAAKTYKKDLIRIV